MKAHNKVRGSYRNIIKCYNEASSSTKDEGYIWYKEAGDIAIVIGRLAGYKNYRALFIGAGVLAALSPQVEWGDNIQWAIQLVSSGTRKQTWNNHVKAMRIVAGEKPLDILGGRKVRAFYKAIVAPHGTSEPVIDRHAAAVYMGRTVTERELNFLASPKVISRVQWAYKKAGKELGVHHHVVQATTWSEWRIKKGIVKVRKWH